MKAVFILILTFLSTGIVSAQRYGVIIIEPNPSNAVVTIDGKDVSNRDTLHVGTGRYAMKATAKNYIDFTDTISIAAGDTFYFSPIMDYSYFPTTQNTGFKNLKSVRILTYTSVGAGFLTTIFAFTAAKRKEELPAKIDAYNNASTPEEIEFALGEYNDTFDAYNSQKDAAIVCGVICATSAIVAIILGENYKAKHSKEKTLSYTDLRRFNPVINNHGNALSYGMAYRF